MFFGFTVFKEVSHKTLLFGAPNSQFSKKFHKNARLQASDASGPKGPCYRDPETEILQKWSYRVLIEVILQDSHTKILHKWSYRILVE